MSGIRRMPVRAVLGAVGALTLAAGGLMAALANDGFDHAEHAKLFPTCEGCHAGVAGGDFATAWPTPDGCATCHDGTIEERVEWAAPKSPGPSNLRFTHPGHAPAELRQAGRDTLLDCADCHLEPRTAWMHVVRAGPDRCLACHGITTAHLEAPDSACAACHLPLAQAASLPAERIRAFEAPLSHQAADFGFAGHGRLASAGPDVVAASCATCHAREFCVTCHVDAPETRAIQALASDPRSLLLEASLAAPSSHQRPDFLENHRKDVGKDATACQTCHTRESCQECHVAQPKSARALYAAGPGRGAGAPSVRRRPSSHGSDFSEFHAGPASSRPESCAACHSITTCLDCHRPNPADGQTRVAGPVGSGARGYHPPAFLTRHPASAYAQETECADCHNVSTFCQTCHAQAGLGANGPLTAGFHDAKQFFLTGHGQAARQSLESCVSCHAERDCLTCHAAIGGRGFNPHGPGFDADRLRRKNPNMCTACHGAAIPR